MGKVSRRTPAHRRPSTPSHYVILAVLVMAMIVVWWRLIFLGQVPFHVDTLCFYLPNWVIGKKLLADGHLLWDPFRNMGQPFLAVPQAQTLYPVRILFSFLDYVNYMRVFILAHVALSALGGYLFVHSRTKNPWASGLAALAFGFGGPFFMRVVFAADFATLAWIPLLLWALSEKRVLWLTVFLTLQWTAGYPPLFILSGLLLIVQLIVDSPPPGTVKKFIIAVIVAAGLTAYQWIPFLEMMRLSVRDIILDSQTAYVNSLNVKTLFRGLFVPSVFHWLWPTGNYYRAMFHLGPIMMGLAGWAVIKGKSREKIWAGAALVFFLLSLGKNLPGYEWISILRLFRYPGNWVVPGFVLGVFLAALAIKKIKNQKTAALLAVLAALDLLIFALPLRHPVGDRTFLTRSHAYDAIETLPADQRLFHSAKIMDTYADWEWESGTLWPLIKKINLPSYGTIFGIREVASHHNLTSRWAADFRRRLEWGEEPLPLLKAAAVGAIVQMPGPNPDDSSAAEFDVFRSAVEMDRVFFASGNGTVTSFQSEPGRATIEAQGPGQLIFSEAYFPGWRVTVNNQLGTVIRYEKMFLGVDLPVGPATVEFRYQPTSARWGGGVSLLTLGWGVWWLKRSRKKRPRRSTSSRLSN